MLKAYEEPEKTNTFFPEDRSVPDFFESNPLQRRETLNDERLYTHSHAEPTLAGRCNVRILLHIRIVQTSVQHHHVHGGSTLDITFAGGFELEWNSRTEKGGGHSKEDHKENSK